MVQFNPNTVIDDYVIVMIPALKPGARSTLSGWVQSLRKMKNVWFMDVNDGSSTKSVSVVTKPLAATVRTGSAVEISGLVAQHFKHKNDVEVQADNVKVLGLAGEDFPLQKKYHSPEFLRQIPQYRWRTRSNAQILRTRSWALHELSTFFSAKNIFQVNAPLLTGSDCEGAGETFKLGKEFFNKEAYLTVSTQLHLEVFAAALGSVWTISPSFRAETSDTNRHLAEFWLVEAEISFCTFSELLDLAESMVKSVVPNAESTIGREILASKRDDDETKQILLDRWSLLRKKWARITYTDAIEKLNASKALPQLEWGDSLPSEHEKYLATTLMNAPTFVTDYPVLQKPFYMEKSSEKTVACFDLLFPDIGEVIGGSMRERSYEELLANMKSRGMNAEGMDWYLDLRRHGSAPHGGYGLGFDRFLMYICGVNNIRDIVGFPRFNNHLPC